MYIVKDSFMNRAGDIDGIIVPTELNLNSGNWPAVLEQLEVFWPRSDRRAQQVMLDGLHIYAPAEPRCSSGITIMPGGSIAIHDHAGETLVADPHAATPLTDHAARRLRTMLKTAKTKFTTMFHNGCGIISQSGLPTQVHDQSCTIIDDIAALQGAIAGYQNGPVLIAWHERGAVAWGLSPAPASLALIAALAGTPVHTAQRAVPATEWVAATMAERTDRIAPALHAYMNDLLADQTTDSLRWALSARAISGTDSLAHRLAASLQILPAHFTEDGKGAPGRGLLDAWPIGDSALQTRPALAMLGVKHQTNCLSVLGALRDVLDNEGLFLIEHKRSSLPHPAILGRATAENLAADWPDATPCAALIAPPADPVGLFSLAHQLAERLEAEIHIAAPAWGFFHRIDARSGADAGNAGWFGLGAGLDELEWI